MPRESAAGLTPAPQRRRSLDRPVQTPAVHPRLFQSRIEITAFVLEDNRPGDMVAGQLRPPGIVIQMDGRHLVGPPEHVTGEFDEVGLFGFTVSGRFS